MVRNLKIMNFLPKRPTRSCLNSTGPFEPSLMAIAINNSIGSRVGTATSKTTNIQHPLPQWNAGEISGGSCWLLTYGGNSTLFLWL